MWNAERPRYFDILLFRQDLRDCRDVFPVFLFGQGSCWKLVAGYGLRELRVASARLIIFPSLQGISSTFLQSPVWIFFH
jgi:hypothetical protein